ncbi:MAG: hypothetical protein MHMPM18_001708 [Marteilia pararefringens]
MPAPNSALMPYIGICVAAGVFLIASGCKLLLEAFPNRRVQSFRNQTEQIHSRDTTPGQLQEPELKLPDIKELMDEVRALKEQLLKLQTELQGDQQRSNSSSSSESEHSNHKSSPVDVKKSSSSPNNNSRSHSPESVSVDLNHQQTLYPSSSSESEQMSDKSSPVGQEESSPSPNNNSGNLPAENSSNDPDI